MGYLHIDNLYKYPQMLMFRSVYVLEKIHGTSTHISWNEGKLGFFAGGCKHDSFVSIFDQEALTKAFQALGHDKVIVYGEGYGGKMQGMKDTYGPDLRFIAFDVKIGDTWLNVPNMADVVTKLGLRHVWWSEAGCDMDNLNRYRDQPSQEALSRGMGEKLSEGVVIRPLIELTDARGNRVIAKHKGEAWSERVSTPRDCDPAKLKVLEDAKAIALEWVTPMRMAHVLDKLPKDDPKIIGLLVNAMVEDVYREGKGEIMESKEARHAIGSRAAQLYRQKAVSELA